MQAKFQFSVAGDGIAIPLVVGRPLLIYFIELHASQGSNTLTFKSGTTVLYGPVEVDRMAQFKMGDSKGDPVLETAAGEAFIINQTQNRPISGTIHYGQG